MKSDFILNLQRKRSNYSHPDQATSQANSLVLLSSGIYTEEERFVFELLQNAVDAHSITSSCLDVKILLEGDYLIFMHNGDAFTERDIEGLCDVGNGNKMNDVKKIGYKGIGFKSVFMRSTNVTVQSGGYCFKFDKSHWNNYWDLHWDTYEYGVKDTEKRYSMPWQIIPIEACPPVEINTDGYNVVTFIKLANRGFIEQKILNLFANNHFLLFLKSENIKMSFWVDGWSRSNIEKVKDGSKVILLSNGNESSKWLLYINDKVEVPSELKGSINSDINTPDKLKYAKTFDLSFAVALDKNNQLRRLTKDESFIYTYLPTSYRFGSEGFPFLVNANFITDAGRQQLHKDSEWNRLIFSKIPSEFLTWMKDLSTVYKNYWEVLPEKSYGSANPLEWIYETNMKAAIDKIPFIPCAHDPAQKLLATDAFMDRMGISEAVSLTSLVGHINRTYQKTFHEQSQIVNLWKGSRILSSYGVFIFDKQKLIALFDDDNVFVSISTELNAKLISFLFHYVQNNKAEWDELSTILKSTKFLLDENMILSAPKEMFFPSTYKEQNKLATDAKILHKDVFDLIKSDKHILDWLSSLGVETLSDITFIKNVICLSGYITKENAIDVVRFLYSVNQKVNLFNELGSYYLKKLMFLSKQGRMMEASALYLGSAYSPIDDLETIYKGDIFISEDYCDGDFVEYGRFLKKLGVNDSIRVKTLQFGKNSDVYSKLKNYVSYAERHEYNHSSWTERDYYMTFSYINIKYVPLINISDTPHQLSKYIWNKVLVKPLELSRQDDYITGPTGGGYTAEGFLCDREEGHMYLGENFLPWVVKLYQTFPATNGKLLLSRELFENSEYIKRLVGPYLPVIDVDGNIHESWKAILNLKNNITIDICLYVLSSISCDMANIEENRVRICDIYQKLIELDALADHNKEKIVNWALSNRILSQENQFVRPSDLSYITLDGFSSRNRVYVGGSSNKEKVIELLSLMGVKIITSESIEAEFESKSESYELKKILKDKVSLLAILASGEDASEEVYLNSKEKLLSLIQNTHYYHCDSIRLSYGNSDDVITKHTFGNNNEFYYTGELRPASIEPLLLPLCKYLGIRGKEKELFIMFFETLDAIKQNLKDKGYNVDLIEDEPTIDSGTINVRLDYHPDENAHQRNMMTGFKGEIVVYEMLKSMGYFPKCNSISMNKDEYYIHRVEINGKVYYCTPNYDKYDISFVSKRGKEIYLEVKATTMSKTSQENMPISYRELSMVEECTSCANKEYFIVRVFDIDTDSPDIYIFNGNLLSYENLENIIES